MPQRTGLRGNVVGFLLLVIARPDRPQTAVNWAPCSGGLLLLLELDQNWDTMLLNTKFFLSFLSCPFSGKLINSSSWFSLSLSSFNVIHGTMFRRKGATKRRGMPQQSRHVVLLLIGQVLDGVPDNLFLVQGQIARGSRDWSD